MTTVDTSRKIERMVEASASNDTVSICKTRHDFPCPACRKKGHRQVKNMLDIGQITSIDSVAPKQVRDTPERKTKSAEEYKQ